MQASADLTMAESRTRWYIKKLARGAVVLGSLASGAIAMRRRMGSPRVRVITYHRFGEAERDQYCVSSQAFEDQMHWLAQSRLAVSLEDVLRFVRGEVKLPDGSVLVTMDDGFQSVWTVAAPILQRYHIPAAIYVTTSAIGNTTTRPDEGEPFMTWEQLVALGASGITIGSHNHTHCSMARLDPQDAYREGRQSKELLELHLGREITSYAYPFGMRRDENPETARILGDCGYDSVFISQHGTVRPGTDPLRIPRIKVEAGEPLWMFKLLCRGGMDPWGILDRVM